MLTCMHAVWLPSRLSQPFQSLLDHLHASWIVKGLSEHLKTNQPLRNTDSNNQTMTWDFQYQLEYCIRLQLVLLL